MPKASSCIAAIAALGLALTPGLADARAGDGGSFGSRGSRTWSMPPPTNTAPRSAFPMQRSQTPYQTPSPAAPYGAPAYPQRSGFTSGLLGGLLGAGLAGMLFGNGLFGGISGIFSFFGFLIQILLIVLIARWVFRRFFRGGAPQFASGPNIFARNAAPRPSGGGVMPGAGGGAQPGAAPLPINPADYQAFEQILRDVQAAWSSGDVNALRGLATQEMVGYFGEQLADYGRRGLRNTVTNVRLLQGDLAEAWRESGREFATVAMRFSMTDVTQDASGRIVSGNPSQPVEATELWTFVRPPGGRWILSSIQQSR